MARSRTIGVAFAGACATAALLVFGSLQVASAHTDDRERGPIEQSTCGHSDHQQRGVGLSRTGAAPHVTGTTQAVRVVVPRTTILRIDVNGRIVAAATSTGCAPGPGDVVYDESADGSVLPAPATQLAHRHWSGDFRTPGVFVPQR